MRVLFVTILAAARDIVPPLRSGNRAVRVAPLDHVIALDERQLLRVVRRYVAYYNRTRMHLALGKDPPETRSVQGSDLGAAIAISEVGGLHHRYERRLAA